MDILYSARVPSSQDHEQSRVESLECWIGELLIKNEELRVLLASVVVQQLDPHLRGEK